LQDLDHHTTFGRSGQIARIVGVACTLARTVGSDSIIPVNSFSWRPYFAISTASFILTRSAAPGALDAKHVELAD